MTTHELNPNIITIAIESFAKWRAMMHEIFNITDEHADAYQIGFLEGYTQGREWGIPKNDTTPSDAF